MLSKILPLKTCRWNSVGCGGFGDVRGCGIFRGRASQVRSVKTRERAIRGGPCLVSGGVPELRASYYSERTQASEFWTGGVVVTYPRGCACWLVWIWCVRICNKGGAGEENPHLPRSRVWLLGQNGIILPPFGKRSLILPDYGVGFFVDIGNFVSLLNLQHGKP
jgi:hypothetical protein